MANASRAYSFGRTLRNQKRAASSGPAVPAGSLNYRVALCSADDVATGDGHIVITRTRSIDVSASIEETRGSLWSRDGAPLVEKRDRPSHTITIRYCPDIVITATAWVYEACSRGPPRWFKVLSVAEKDVKGNSARFWALTCRLVEKSDLAVRPGQVESSVCPPQPLPPGVTL
jgi:hypothetical protein